MKRYWKVKRLLLSATYLLAAMGLYTSNVSAQWYISGGGGVVLQNDSDLTDTFSAGSATGTSEFNNGYAIYFAMGYAWENFRFEGEASYRQSEVDQITIDTLTVAGLLFTTLGTVDVSGDTSALSLMANGWYEFDTGGNWVPFVGGGLGVAKVGYDFDSIGGIAVSYDERDTVVAYQAGGGIGYKITDKTIVSLGYRYFATADPTTDDETDKIDGEYGTHNFMLGVVNRF